ncbi:hypothetical protein B0H14DRAFT_2604144 [Mycena olivaceomarginata]|nr:hypothetical protein B0H14DRAFT_2604144 [Mycena olivaceomarginata]
METRPERKRSPSPRSSRTNSWQASGQQHIGVTRRAPVIPVQKHRRVEPGVNVHATVRKHRGDTANKMQNLAADVDELEIQCKECTQVLSEKHGMKMLLSSGFKTRCKASLYNAKTPCIMCDLNEDRGLGERYKIPNLKRMVAADLSMLEGFTPEEEEMMAKVVAKCKRKYHGNADAKRTVERLMLESQITGLAEHVGMIRFAMFTRDHIHDTTVHVTIQLWGALDFFHEVLKKDPADISTLFELWARYVADTSPGDTGSDTLIAMQQECTVIIKADLHKNGHREDKGRHELQKNYVKALVEGKNIRLVRWPKGVDFKCMLKQSTIWPLCILRDALKCGTCRWKVLTAGEKLHILTQFKEMVKNIHGHFTKFLGRLWVAIQGLCLAWGCMPGITAALSLAPATQAMCAPRASLPACFLARHPPQIPAPHALQNSPQSQAHICTACSAGSSARPNHGLPAGACSKIPPLRGLGPPLAPLVPVAARPCIRFLMHSLSHHPTQLRDAVPKMCSQPTEVVVHERWAFMGQGLQRQPVSMSEAGRDGGW